MPNKKAYMIMGNFRNVPYLSGFRSSGSSYVRGYSVPKADWVGPHPDIGTVLAGRLIEVNVLFADGVAGLALRFVK